MGAPADRRQGTRRTLLVGHASWRRSILFTNKRAAAWSRTGRKSPYGQYYLQIAPGDCFIGAGKWMPESPVLQQLREDISRHPTRIRAVLCNENIRKHFLGGMKTTEDQAVKAFRKHNDSNALKRPPKVA